MKVQWIIISAVLLVAIGCAAQPGPASSTSTPEDAIRTLRELAGLPDLPVQFVGMVTMANSPDGNLQVGSYKDSQGRLYSVDLATNQVVEVDGRAAMPTQPAGTLMADSELKTRAETLARTTTPNFDTVTAGLTFTSGNKGGGLSFFDWRGQTAPGASMPRFIQVALSGDGTLVGYINTVILPQ